MSLGRQIRTCPGRSNRIFRGRPRDVGKDVVGSYWGQIFADWLGRDLLWKVCICHFFLLIAQSHYVRFKITEYKEIKCKIGLNSNNGRQIVAGEKQI